MNNKVLLLLLIVIIAIGGFTMVRFKDGVDVSGLRLEISRAISIINGVFKTFGEQFTITAAFKMRHNFSYHNFGSAIDIRLPDWGKDKNPKLVAAIGADIKKALRNVSPFYDVVIEKDHYHIEFDLRRAGFNV